MLGKLYMLTGKQVAKYFLSLDSKRELFTKKRVRNENCEFYEGNARLNKLLHIAQNVYIAKTGNQLFSSPLFAYKNGAVVRSVVNNYSRLLNENDSVEIPEDTRIFLNKIYKSCYNADINELIALSHEDPEWGAKPPVNNKSQQMNPMLHVEEYKEQYADFIKVLDGMDA
ncbi:MAG: DUF4065 domain-containing protein [Treponema sp.]|nr:DUF4065 domain-containing protein [Treponema sp.]